MHDRARKVLAALTVAMVAVLFVGVLAAAQVINLPGNLRETLGFEKATPNPPCHLRMYRNDPKSPPPEPGHWRSEPEMPRTQVEATAVAIGPVVYTAEGSPPGNLHTVLAFDTKTKTWSEPTHIPIGLDHAEAATYDGKLYLAGGYLDGEEPTTDFWQYDPKTNRWTQLPSMHQPPRAAGAAAVIGHKLYVVGGRGEKDHSLTIFESYDPTTDEWKTLPPIPLGVASPRAVAADGKVVVVGGEDQLNWEEGDGWVTPSAWAFDPKLNRWARLPDMRFERRGGGAGFADGRVYAIGGSYCPGLKPGGPVGTHTVESLSVGAVDRAFESD